MLALHALASASLCGSSESPHVVTNPVVAMVCATFPFSIVPPRLLGRRVLPQHFDSEAPRFFWQTSASPIVMDT